METIIMEDERYWIFTLRQTLTLFNTIKQFVYDKLLYCNDSKIHPVNYYQYTGNMNFIIFNKAFDPQF